MKATSVIAILLSLFSVVIQGCSRHRAYEWNHVLCQICHRNNLVVLKFARKSEKAEIFKEVETGASCFQRYKVEVLSKQHLLFYSADIGCVMFRQNGDITDDSTISWAMALPIGRQKNLYVVYSGNRVDHDGKEDRYGSFFNEVTVLMFGDKELIAKKVLHGRFRIGVIDDNWRELFDN